MRNGEFGGILDRDQPLMCRDRRNQRLGQRGLSRAGRTRDDDVAPGPHRKLEKLAPGAGFFQGQKPILVGRESSLAVRTSSNSFAC